MTSPSNVPAVVTRAAMRSRGSLGTGLALLLSAALPAAANPDPAQAAALADSLRREAGQLAAAGRLEEAVDLVERHARDIPAVWQSMFAGKLELDGDAASKGYEGAAAETAPDQMRGEAVFRLGQYHYAASRYHFAIPQFRLYLARHPAGLWSQEAGYWMAYSCIQLVKQQPHRAAYLDTALNYLRDLERRGPDAYYWPLAHAAEARVHLMRADTAAALSALREARTRAPLEERPGVLLLSLQAASGAAGRGEDAGAFTDSLRWGYPLSPEARSLPKPPANAAPGKPARAPLPDWPSGKDAGTHSLQVGAFSQRENAERMRGELTARKISARVERYVVSGRTLHRVLAGDYPDAETALREGRRLLTPLGYAFRVVEP